MPCGHGRVLRHLTKLFPNAQIDACDLDSEGVNFCSDTFGANPIISQEDLTLVRFPDLYDLIWIGILFTHLPLNITEKWLNFLADQLTERGIIVATFHGRWAMALHERVPYISEDRWETIKSDYESLGYGFAPYKRDETHDFIESTYGISVSKPQLIVEIISRIPETRIYFYQEKAWGHNHDVVAFGRPGWTGHPNVKY
jgi:hypothetical protein